MTKDEILAMKAGKEFDVLVAKEIFGIEVEWDYRIGDISHVLPKLPYLKGEPRTVLGPMAHSISNTIYEYSIDPRATWQVLKKLREEYWCIDLRIADGCLVIMELLRTPPIRVEVDAGTPFEKLPEAICKAALLAKLEVGNGL